jgi:hypothetical protein
MRKTALLFISFFSLTSLHAQEKTISIKAEERPLEEINRSRLPGIMLVPFDLTMYRTDYDAELAKANQVKPEDIRDFFRKAVDTSLYHSLYENFRVISLFMDDEELINDMKLIYGSISYKYEEKEKVQGNPKNVSRFTSKKEEPSAKERYMAAELLDDQLLKYLKDKYNVEYFIFINEFNLYSSKNSSYSDFEKEDYQKVIKIHYTIFNSFGERIDSGAATSFAGSKEKNIHVLVRKVFPELSRFIANSLNN